MNLNRTLQVRIAHVLNAERHEYEDSSSNERVEYHGGYTHAVPGHETRQGTIEFEGPCSVCSRRVPLQLNLQRMVHFPADDMARHPEIRADLVERLRVRALFWIAPFVIAFFVLSFFAAIYLAPEGTDSTLQFSIVFLGEVALVIFLCFWIGREWNSALFWKDRKLIQRGERDLLISEKEVLRRKLPQPHWSELVTVIREVGIVKDRTEHRLLSDESGDCIISGWDTDTHVSVTGENVFALSQQVENQFDGQCVELGVRHNVPGPFEASQFEPSPTPILDRLTYAVVAICSCLAIAAAAAIVAALMGLERSEEGYLADLARNRGISESFVVILAASLPPFLAIFLFVLPKPPKNETLRVVSDVLYGIAILFAVFYVPIFWLDISPWNEFDGIGDFVKTVFQGGAWTILFLVIAFLAAGYADERILMRTSPDFPDDKDEI